MIRAAGRRPVPRRTLVVLLVATVVALLLVALPLGWLVQRSVGVRAVHEHPTFTVFEEIGWEVTHDDRFRAGVLDQLFLGGMIEHPIQREVHFAPDEDRAGVLAGEVEDALFGARGQDEFVAHGLRWERRVISGDVVRYSGHAASTRGRLTMVTVSVSPGAVHVRSFGR
jgi:hypothetical protein